MRLVPRPAHTLAGMTPSPQLLDALERRLDDVDRQLRDPARRDVVTGPESGLAWSFARRQGWSFDVVAVRQGSSPAAVTLLLTVTVRRLWRRVSRTRTVTVPLGEES